ncbi:hypothetical protein BDAP_001841, partial [Binucleata daphniae]
LYNASGEEMKTGGMIKDLEFTIEDKIYKHKFIVCKDLSCDVILGRDFFGNNIKEIQNKNEKIQIITYNTRAEKTQTNSERFQHKLNLLLKKYKEIFRKDEKNYERAISDIIT